MKLKAKVFALTLILFALFTAPILASCGKQNADNNATDDVKTYTVTLNSNEATECGELTAYTYGAGATLPVPTKTGHNFMGWFDNAEFAGDAVTQISATETGDKTFYAKWEVATYTVTLSANEATECGELTAYTYGTAATLPVPTKTGYNFIGWFDNAEFAGDAVTEISATETGDKTFFAKWVAKTYTVTLNANEATECGELTAYTYGAGATLPVPTKTGYNFMGWFDNAEFAGDAVTQISATDMGNKTFFAKWEVATYTVTLNANEATECGELTAYTYGTAATLPVPTKTGYDFMGWFDNAEFTGDAVTEISATETGDKTFFAKWEAKTYTVTLNANEATECGELTAYTYGAGATLPVPTKTGYNFMGWFDNAEFAGDAVIEISATDIGNKTFFAKWVILTYQVKFLNADGSVLKEGEADYGTVPEYAGTPTIASNRYVYTFNGWDKELTAVTGEQLYIATYEKASKEAYSCTYSSAHTDYSFEETATADDGVEWNITMEATKNFYHNGGVKLVSTTGDYITITNAPDSEKTIYAQYNGDMTKGYVENKGYAKGGGEGAFTMTFKFAKVNGKIYCYADGRLIGSYSSTDAAGMFSEEAVLKASTFRGNADTDVLKFTVTLDKTLAINGAVADIATEFGVNAAGNFTFTAAIQGTGLYTYAGIRIRSGENFIDIYSHTYGGNRNFVRFNGWNIAVNGEGKVNIANDAKAVYKVVKTDEKMYFYLNDTLIFEFDKNYQLAWEWGNRFFTEGAVFSFGLYTEAGAGGTGYACDVNIDYAN